MKRIRKMKLHEENYENKKSEKEKTLRIKKNRKCKNEYTILDSKDL